LIALYGIRRYFWAIIVLQNSFYSMKHRQLRYIHGLKTADKEIFGELFSEYYQPLCRWCAKYVSDPQEAEEIVQDTFVKLWEKRSDLQIGVSLNAYLYRSVTNRALNHQNHLKVRKAHNDYTVASAESYVISPDELENEELIARYERALAAMPEKRRQAFLMSRNEGLKYAEIAERLSVSVKTVEAHLSNALEDLRISLREYLPVISLLIVLLSG
jgi:RNA polymerase sigma-70 factor, ECF subfamily